MKVMVWDEINGFWEHELDIPSTTRDPEVINRELGKAILGNEEGDGYEVRSHSITGPIITIETRSDRNHLAIIIVNLEDQ